jgi:hypothetical protein
LNKGGIIVNKEKPSEMLLRRMALTPRDFAILQKLYDMTVMSFNQVWRTFFSGKDISTISNRLKKLEGGGYIHRLKVPRLMGLENSPSTSVVFQIAKNGIKELQKRTSTEILRSEPVRLHGHSIEHDLLLVDVLSALSQRFGDIEIIHGRLLNQEETVLGVWPDAILKLPNGKTKWAIELELTAKSENRYREIVLKYRLSNHFERIVYVTGNPAIKQKLESVLGARPKTLGGIPFTEKFYFVGLKDLLENPKEALITNGEAFLTKEVCA